MRGDLRTNPGVIPMALRDIFSVAEHSESRLYFLRVSYMEIYNEVIRDLLNPDLTNLKIHESAEVLFIHTFTIFLPSFYTCVDIVSKKKVV